jgi:hypothetical protein
LKNFIYHDNQVAFDEDKLFVDMLDSAVDKQQSLVN